MCWGICGYGANMNLGKKCPCVDFIHMQIEMGSVDGSSPTWCEVRHLQRYRLFNCWWNAADFFFFPWWFFQILPGRWVGSNTVFYKAVCCLNIALRAGQSSGCCVWLPAGEKKSSEFEPQCHSKNCRHQLGVRVSCYNPSLLLNDIALDKSVP